MPNDYMISGTDFRTELEVVRNIQPKSTLFRNKFFNPANDEFLPTEKAQYDVVTEGAPMARYINPRVYADPTDRAGFETREITTPYIQESRIITADMIRDRRRAGENVYSLVTPEERARQYRDEDYLHCIDAIDNRVEHQCASMITTGRVDIVNKERSVDYYVDYGLKYQLTLTGGNRWGQVGVKPFTTLQLMFNSLLESGYVADEVLMGEKAYRAFEASEDVQKLLDIRRFELGIIDPKRVQGITTEQYKATIKDPLIDIYTYNAVYKSPEDGRTYKFIPDNMVLMHCAEARDNKLFHGAVTIIDESEEWVTAEGRYVPEHFITRRPSTEQIYVTSRPIPAPKKIDSWYVAYVL